MRTTQRARTSQDVGTSRRRYRNVAIAATVATLASLVVVVGARPAAAGPPFNITTVAGTGDYGDTGDGGPATQAQLTNPYKVISDAAGDIFIAEFDRVRKVDPAGIITTYAGGGSPADGIGDGLPADQAAVGHVTGLALDAGGNLFITDGSNNTLRRVDAAAPHVITTVAGDGNRVYSGDGGPAAVAEFNTPSGVAIDGAGNVYIGDLRNRAVRKIDAATGTISTLAAFSGFQQRPNDVAIDGGGNVFVTTQDETVLEVSPSGTTTTYAGTSGVGGFAGDGGPASAAVLFRPASVDVDAAGQVYVADYAAERIRKIDASPNHIITTVAGSGDVGSGDFAGDGGDPVAARLNSPSGVGIDHHGGFYIGDSSNVRVRHVAPLADLLGVTMTDAPHSIKLGQGNVTLSITVNNYSLSNQTATNVVADLGLAASLHYVSANASQGSCAAGGSAVACQLGSLAPGAQATISVVVTPTVAEVAASTVTVHATEPDPLARDDTAATNTFVSAADCGKVVTASTTFTKDLGPCGVNALIAGADNIDINLNGHQIYALPGLDQFDSIAGVRIPNHKAVTLHNGTVRGFDAGIVVMSGGKNVFTGLTVRGNVGPDGFSADLGDGIALFDSSYNTVQGNTITGNGSYDGVGVLGSYSDHNLIQNNLIANTIDRPQTLGRGQGVIINSGALGENTGRLVVHNDVIGNTIRDNDSAGIANNNNSYSTFANNTITGNGVRFFNDGNGIGVRNGPFAQTNAEYNIVHDNEIHGNGFHGIIVYAESNTFYKNNVTGNAIGGGFDLFDYRSFNSGGTCYNQWSRNIFGTAGANPGYCFDKSNTLAAGTANAPVAASAAGPAPAGSADAVQPPARHMPS